MLISFNWLKKYVNLPDSVSPEEVAEKLKLATVEVEKVINQGKSLDNIVVGKILKCEKHPNADKLKVCLVDAGTQKLNIVCGGSNVVDGMFVAVAKVGAKVKWHGEGELVELKPTTIRGVESHGMICAAEEIGLGEMFPKKGEKEILDLSSMRSAQVGKNLAEVFNFDDAILEIDNKSLSNRPDLWGHYGIARDVAVLFNRVVNKYEVKEIKSGKDVKINLKVEDAKLCPRYMAVAISGVKVGESPDWLKQKLMAVGQRPINNIVDITNYVMLDLGQPMHAFDAKQLTINNKQLTKLNIVVKRAKAGEKFVTLDEVERGLDESVLMITNGEKSLAVAGVMGGMESGITNDTTTIVFESANFDSASIRKTSIKLGLRSESSARFEKSLDPNMCATALARAVELTLECCQGATVASAVVDNKHFHLATGSLQIPLAIFKQKLGLDIPAKTVMPILTHLGFEVKEKKNLLLIKIPSWRATKDISIAEDVVEEVARVYDYNNIPSVLPSQPIAPPAPNQLRQLEWQAGEILARELNFTEVYNYSFVSKAQIKILGEDIAQYLELDNPLSKAKPYLRRHLLENLLENIGNNIADKNELRLFEIGKVYHADKAGARVSEKSDELLPRQDSWLTAVYVGKKDELPWREARRVAETLSERFNFALEVKVMQEAKPWMHPSRAALVIIGETAVGQIYELNPEVGAAVGLNYRVGVATVNLSLLAEHLGLNQTSSKYHPLSLYPEVSRDIALVVKQEVTHAEIAAALNQANPLISRVELFDVYEGENIGIGYKSMAFHLTYSNSERTLTSQEIDAVEAKVAKALKEKFGAEIRV